jgi:DNA-binding transcriptional regulator YhcF (GntR family)
MPSVRHWAQATVCWMNMLRERGLVVTVRGKGTFVADQP